MSYKSILFFLLLFGFLIFGYFYYDIFLKIFPISNFIKFFILVLGLISIFVPNIITKIKEGEDFANIKEFIIKKYKKKD
jgi:predicted ABC-type exoprotein transport system permease subunit